jgi:hypothetical protein
MWENPTYSVFWNVFGVTCLRLERLASSVGFGTTAGLGPQEEPAVFRRNTRALRVLRDSGPVKRKGRSLPHRSPRYRYARLAAPALSHFARIPPAPDRKLQDLRHPGKSDVCLIPLISRGCMVGESLWHEPGSHFFRRPGRSGRGSAAHNN